MITRTVISCLIITLFIASPVSSQDQITLKPVSDDVYQVIRQFYEYDRSIPFDAHVVETTEMDNCSREKIVFTGVWNSRVPGYLAFPKNGQASHPCILLLHGFTSNKDAWFENYEWKSAQITNGLLDAGCAVLCLDATYHGERSSEFDYGQLWSMFTNDYQYRYTYISMFIKTVIEYRRALDYLQTRENIDTTKIGVHGLSMGGSMTCILTALEPGIKASVASTAAPIAPISKKHNQPHDPTNSVPHIRCPFLLLMGKKDTWYTVDSGNQLYSLIGSPEKNIIWYDSEHNLPAEHVDDVVKWFKEYL